MHNWNETCLSLSKRICIGLKHQRSHTALCNCRRVSDAWLKWNWFTCDADKSRCRWPVGQSCASFTSVVGRGWRQATRLLEARAPRIYVSISSSTLSKWVYALSLSVSLTTVMLCNFRTLSACVTFLARVFNSCYRFSGFLEWWLNNCELFESVSKVNNIS